MIFHHHRAIFFHIGKTAGVSVEKWLDPSNYDARKTNRKVMFGWDKERGVYLQHASVELVKELTATEIFENYFKFSIVRNPFTRAISVYYYLYDQHQKQHGSFQNYIKSLPRLLTAKYLYLGSHHIPQVFYTHLDQHCVCDQIVKFEHLPQCLNPIKQRLGLDTDPKHHNKIIHPMRPQTHPAEIYSNEMTQIIQDVYAADFEAFNYSPSPQDV